MKHIAILRFAILAATAAVATSINGQNLISNGDFDVPGTDDSPIPSWTISGTGNVVEYTEGATTANTAAVLNIGGDSEGSVLSQTFATTAGTYYRVEFDAGIFGQPASAPLQLV